MIWITCLSDCFMFLFDRNIWPLERTNNEKYLSENHYFFLFPINSSMQQLYLTPNFLKSPESCIIILISNRNPTICGTNPNKKSLITHIPPNANNNLPNMPATNSSYWLSPGEPIVWWEIPYNMCRKLPQMRLSWSKKSGIIVTGMPIQHKRQRFKSLRKMCSFRAHIKLPSRTWSLCLKEWPSTKPKRLFQLLPCMHNAKINFSYPILTTWGKLFFVVRFKNFLSRKKENSSPKCSNTQSGWENCLKKSESLEW